MQITLFDDEGMGAAKAKWRKAIEGEGAFCPCCGRWGKVYKIKLSEHLALCLRWIATHGDKDGWVNVQNTAPRWMLKSKTYTLLEHWNFIESQSKRSGVWRANAAGVAFASGIGSASSAAYIYDNTVWALDPEQVTFRGCFGKHFDFDEMMSTRFDWSTAGKKK